MCEPIFLNPIFKDYIWGGVKLKKDFNKEVENEDCTAESWEISTNSNGESVIKNGKFIGKTLTELFANLELRKKIFGEKCMSMHEFPILVKFIDASSDLSVQVHPNDEYAIKNENSLGKTEMWYILECNPNSKIICGVKEGVTKEQLANKVNDNKIVECLNYMDIKKGDAIYIEAGTVHALLGGVVVAEVQQNSNITYRLYDWDRKGKDGKPRELHIKKSLDVIDINSEPKVLNKNEVNVRNNILACKYFKVNKIKVDKEFGIITPKNSFTAINVIEGEGVLYLTSKKYNIKKGDSFIIPASASEYKILGDLELLETYI